MTDKPHTPTTRGVRNAYIRVWNGQIQGANAETVAAEFDRWLDQVKADAWDEGYQDGYSDGLSDGHSLDNMRDPNENPYRTDQESHNA